MGKGGGSILKGSDCFYAHLPHLKQWAIELLEENNFSGVLPDDAFVFFMHQGYQFAFMCISEGDNPPVYYYNESYKPPTFVLAYNSFDQFLATEVNRYIG